MIISKTPMRISFFGGGTDLPQFYKKEFGCVLSASINKYSYLVVHPAFDDKNILSYSIREVTNDVGTIKNNRIRAIMKKLNIVKGLEIHSLAEVPAGTGLGSSSSFTVGLLNALHAYRGKFVTKEILAKEACEIEIGILKEPIGKQDQYAASFGGFNYIQFNKDDSVFVEPVVCSKDTLKDLEKHLVLFYTGITRKAAPILKEQGVNMSKLEKLSIMEKMRDIALEAKADLNNNKISRFGEYLDRSWRYKRTLANGITNQRLDEIYERAIKAGAVGGKILGAGGGGFFLFFCEPNKQKQLEERLSDLRRIDFEFEFQGSTIIYGG